ncbi:MAG: bifunctional 2-C-methyl-D-erythritol 4-phosphate cytidylyltransferase/2-C-methyl-D-erythritol 2,4-cyclodiphosphate synthase [Rhodospirillaceae bacterium]
MSGTIALIVGAGRGNRFGGDVPKQYCELDGEPLLRLTLRAFLDHPGIDQVQPVIHPEDIDLFRAAATGLAVREPVSGGGTRQDSVRLGLESVAGTDPDLVLVHDAARPFVSTAVITRVLEALKTHAGAIPALIVTDTLKRAADGDNRAIGETVPRDGLWRAQTPQGFRFAELLAAHRNAMGEALTDDAAVAERHGLTVAIVEGSEENVKITTADDLKKAQTQAFRYQTGMGFDVHAFGDGDHVYLCGHRITLDHGLVGHSDADVGLHAVTDAVLGAIAAGDIGDHFPPSDPQWKGAPSDMFLAHAAKLVAEAGGEIVNVDVTLICERPKIGPHRDAMRRRLAKIIGIDQERVSIKATTTEKLGFTGRGEGIAAQAITCVRLRDVSAR